jgi:hypothetical protein
MRRILIFGALVGLGILIVRARAPKLHERLMARWPASSSNVQLRSPRTR